MLARAGLPLGARLWTFGSPRHADGDGWLAEHGSAAAGHGFLTVTPDGGVVEIVSPGDLGIARHGRARRSCSACPTTRACCASKCPDSGAARPGVADARERRRRRSSCGATAGWVLALPNARGAPLDRIKVRIELDAGGQRDAGARRAAALNLSGARVGLPP